MSHWLVATLVHSDSRYRKHWDWCSGCVLKDYLEFLKVKNKLNVHHKNVFDYANSEYRSDFLDIWLNNKTQTARNRLNSADRGFKPCNVCDVEGDLIGKTHYEAWKKIS